MKYYVLEFIWYIFKKLRCVRWNLGFVEIKICRERVLIFVFLFKMNLGVIIMYIVEEFFFVNK